MIEETLTRAHDKRGGFKKLDVKIPEKFMGFVIGRGREKLNDIETRTGVALKVIDNHLHIKGSTEQEKKSDTRSKGHCEPRNETFTDG